MKKIDGTIIDVKVTEGGRTLVMVEYDGNVVGYEHPEDKNISSINKEELNYKVIKSEQNNEALVKASGSYSALIGGARHRVVSHDTLGNFIVGPTAFTANPENIRIGGVFRLNGLMTSTMASTIITPIPTLVFDAPYQDTLKTFAKVLNDFQSFLTGL